MSTAILGRDDSRAAAPGGPRRMAAPLRPGVAGRRPGWLLLLWAVSLGATLVLVAAEGLSHAAVAVLWGGAIFALGGALVRVLSPADRVDAMRLYTGAFLARYAFAVVLRSALVWSGSPMLAGASDYLNYDSYGWAQAEVWRSGDFSWILSFSDAGYFYLVAAIYTLTGHYVLAPTLVSAVFGGFAAVVTFKLGTRLFGRGVGMRAALLAAFIPTLLFWSSLLYKDTIVSFLYVASVYLAVCLRERFSISRAVMLALALGPLFVLRTEMAAILVLLAGLFLVSGWSGLSSRRLAAAGIAGLGLLVMLTLTDRLGIGAGGLVAGLETAVELLQEPESGFSAEVASRGGEGLSSRLYGRNLLASPHLLVLALGLLVVTPIPGTVSPGMNTASFLAPGQLVWLFLLPALGIGAVRILRNPRAEKVFMLVAAAAAIVGILLGGYFSNPRYLVQVVPLLVVVMSVGVDRLGRGWYLYLGGICAVVSVLMVYGLIR